MLPPKALHTNSDFEQESGLLVDSAQSVPASTSTSKTKWSIVVLVAAMVFLATSVRGVGHPPQGRVQTAVEFNNIEEEAWINAIYAMPAAKEKAILLKRKVKEVHKIWLKATKDSGLMTQYLDNMTSAESELANVDCDFRGVLVFLSEAFGIAVDQFEAKFQRAEDFTPVSIKGPKQMLSQSIDSALEDFKPMKLKFADLQKRFSVMDKIGETKRLFENIGDKCDKLALYARRDYDNLNQINGKLKVEHWLISVASASMWRTTVVHTMRDTIKSINNVLLEYQ